MQPERYKWHAIGGPARGKQAKDREVGQSATGR